MLEHCVVPEEGNGVYCGPGLHWSPKFDHGTWTVWIDHQPQFKTFTVHARHQETGASLDATEAETGDLQLYRSLAKARDRAGRMATVLRGTMKPFDWRAQSTKGAA